MATRRTPYTADPSSSGPPTSNPAIFTPPTSSSVAPAVPTPIILKLLFFTFLMVTAPLSSYYLSYATIFRNNATYAGALAALVANVVLVGYILVAVFEDEGEPGPGTGVVQGVAGGGKKDE